MPTTWGIIFSRSTKDDSKLRKEGIINPIRPGHCWLYSEEQVRQIPALIAEARKCELPEMRCC